jgi:DNA-binding PadR family transcriptional regulator
VVVDLRGVDISAYYRYIDEQVDILLGQDAPELSRGTPMHHFTDDKKRGHRGRRRGPGPGPGGFGPGAFGPGGPGHGPGYGHHHGGGRGRGGRGRRRGDVRDAILALLAEGPRNGYQLMSEIAERSDGIWRPSAGSVYPALGLLEDEGLIEQVEGDSGKTYALTEAGRAHVAERGEELTEPWARVAGPRRGMLDVRAEVHQLGLALRQVAMAGTEEQVQAARKIVEDARKALYRILAE